MNDCLKHGPEACTPLTAACSLGAAWRYLTAARRACAAGRIAVESMGLPSWQCNRDAPGSSNHN
jgi:hypothetical protein